MWKPLYAAGAASTFCYTRQRLLRNRDRPRDLFEIHFASLAYGTYWPVFWGRTLYRANVVSPRR